MAMGVVAVAMLLRFFALGYGLPHLYNPDEPHLIDMAVSFVSGDLRPHSFKHPTLWPMTLSGLYGLWFAFWSAFGLRKGALDFVALYGFEPTGFYLIARFVAALSSLAALFVVARAERSDKNGLRWPYGALILAASPLLVNLAHAATPDSLMLLLSAGAWLCALRFQSGGARGWLYGSAALVGAACSTQYAAAPAALMVPLAWLLREEGLPPLLWLVQALLVTAFAFFAGSPFIAIDLGRFIMDWKDHADLGRLRPHDGAVMAKSVAYNLWNYAGEGSPAGAAAVLGFVLMLRSHARRACLLAVPIAAYIVVLAVSPDGGWQHYLLGAFPALALLSSEGLILLGGENPWRRGAVVALVSAPGLFLSGHFLTGLTLPDTRAQAEIWLKANVPAGEAVLLDLPHASPRLAGGYRIYRIQRSAISTQTGGDFLDVRPGLDPVRAVRARWVVTSSAGADPRRLRELATFFSELAAGAELVQEFPSEEGKTAGPWLRVWKLRR